MSKGKEGDAEKTVAVLETGDHFGEVALLRDVPRTATIRTLASCIFLTLQRGNFLELIERIPDFRTALERVAGRRAAAETEALDRTAPVSLRRAFEAAPSSRALFERHDVLGVPSLPRRLDVDQRPRIALPSPFLGVWSVRSLLRYFRAASASRPSRCTWRRRESCSSFHRDRLPPCR